MLYKMQKEALNKINILPLIDLEMASALHSAHKHLVVLITEKGRLSIIKLYVDDTKMLLRFLNNEC